MAPPAPCRPRSLPALMEELVEEILLRIPPDDPAHLVRAALVCKPWRRILTDPGFLHRYRAFHRAPPLLGYIHTIGHNRRHRISPLAPTSAASPLSTMTLPELQRDDWVLDCRHGRVLICTAFMPQYLFVWDPITGSRKKLSLPGYSHQYLGGAVLCAVDGCDHLDCHDGPFLVVFAGSGDVVEVGDDGYEIETWVAIYSSKTGQWSTPITIHDDCIFIARPTLLIGDTLYFIAEEDKILKFDLGAHELSVIELPRGYLCQAIPMEVDGGLGFISMIMDDNCIYMSHYDDANNDTGEWAEHLVMELETLLPKDPSCSCSHELVGLLEGTNTVFISASRGEGLFTLDLKSRKVKKVGEIGVYYAILPYTGFYTPDLAIKGAHTITTTKTYAMIDPPT